MLKYSAQRGMAGFTPAVFSAIAYSAALSFGDKIILTSQKGRPVRKSPDAIDKFGFINVEENRRDNSVSIEVFMILKFGTSISDITKQFAGKVRQDTEQITGMSVDNIWINIVGVRSKKTARRELRITC